MEKVNKGLCVSTVFFVLLSLVLAGSVIYLSRKNSDLSEKVQLSSENANETAAVEPAESSVENTPSDSNGVASIKVPAASRSNVGAPVKTEFHEMEVLSFSNNKDSIGLNLSKAPDMAVVKEYVTVDPAPEGGLSFSLSQSWHGQPQLNISGDFAYRTNLTLRVRKGLPIHGLSSSSNVVVQPLQKDYVHTFTRSDENPYIKFVGNGRYLPPIGKRAMKIETVNISSMDIHLSRVPAANVIQMLALEEAAYKKIYKDYWGNGEDFVDDVSSYMSSKTINMKNVLNTPETASFSFDDFGTPVSNGVFFVHVIGSGNDVGPIRINSRVVCISDLALSVRKTESKFFVWVTSFTTGLPVEGVEIAAYSSANVLVAKGRTGADGLCKCETVSGDEPFAVVATRSDGGDMSFMALKSSAMVNENYAPGRRREEYLGENDVSAFAWTERGIYRHGEKIFFHALLRDKDFAAPKSMPVEILAKNPGGSVYLSKTVLSDDYGAVHLEDVAIPDEQPSGTWTFALKIPGESGSILAERFVKIEDFAPPQVRTRIVPGKTSDPKDFAFEISAEHLYGGPAAGLMCDGAVVFEDAEFAPAGWEGWRFGDANRSLTPNFRMLKKTALDQNGKARLSAPMFKETGLPAAAVRATVQGTVFEDGGRPATARDTVMLHYYPYYIGTTLKNWIKRPANGVVEMSVACVAPDGKCVADPKKLTGTLVKIDNVYSFVKQGSTSAWKCDRVRTTVAENLEIETAAGRTGLFKLPVLACGDYELEISDPDGESRYSSSFYLSDWGDESVKAPLGNPSSVALTADKNLYRPGDKPKIRVRSPFAGKALLSVFHDDLIYTDVITLTNATTEVELHALKAEHVPNVDVSLCVVHGVSAKSNHLAARAHGEITLPVRRAENELEVKIDAVHSGKKLDVSLDAPGANTAVITVVDEGINILTSEKTPDPVAAFARLRTGKKYLFDLYNRVLPIVDDGELGVSGLKTGGDAAAVLLSRVSPVGSRRFKPLSLWTKNVPVENGKARVAFDLSEFAGEVRVTAVAYSKNAVGAAAGQFKVSPKLVVQPDAPRFVAPEDEFVITLPMTNRSGMDGDVAYKIYTAFDMDGDDAHKIYTAFAFEDSGDKMDPFQTGAVFIRKDCTKTLPFTVVAPKNPGHVKIVFETSGFGESHRHEIELPVRPAVAWKATSGVEVLNNGESFKLPRSSGEFSKFTYNVSELPASELKDALEWLADYPHGCLEQTVSRIFPLITAGGILNAFSSIEAVNRMEYVEAGVRRVESMFVGGHYFMTWPHCYGSRADKELSLYAAHFLVEAQKASVSLGLSADLARFLKIIATGESLLDSAYACHTLALADAPDKGRMYGLYDSKNDLDALSRARLARAFVLIGDRARAKELLAKNIAPASLKEASFTLIALLELGDDDKRIDELVKYVSSKRCDRRYSWGTTSDNAHAILALGEYFRRMPIVAGLSDVRESAGVAKNFGQAPAFLSWKRLDLPKPEEVKAESNGIKIEREYFTATGEKRDLSKFERGDFVVVRIAVSSDEPREFSDLVVEDLLPGALEGVRSPIIPAVYGWMDADAHQWVLRHEIRDDRVLVFSKKFSLNKNEKAYFHFPVRVVSAGTYIVPGVSVEAMYQPELHARTSSSRVEIRK